MNKFVMMMFILSQMIFMPVVVKAEQLLEIYLVRHAEKQLDGTKDPELTEQGFKRADKLAMVLNSKKVSAIYSSDYKRTINTAKPLADVIKVNIQRYNPGKLKEFAAQLKQLSGVVLVVGHSNTTPDLVQFLGGNPHGKIDESVYDRLYHLKFNNNAVITDLLKY